MTNAIAANAAVGASEWYAAMPLPALSADPQLTGGLRLRRYVDTPPDVMQPPLADHLICMHLGGAKRVNRWHEGRATVFDVDRGSLTVMPAFQTNRWRTTGPVDFVHLALTPTLVGRIVVEEFDRDPDRFGLEDMIGGRLPFAEAVFNELVLAVESRQQVGRLYAESLIVIFVVALLRAKAGGGAQSHVAGGLGSRLRRVVDYMSANLAADIGLVDLTALTGLSRAQFYRAFRQSTGTTPARYLDRLRVDRARELVAAGTCDPVEIAAAVGIDDAQRLSLLFRRYVGTTLRRYARRG